MPHKLREGEKLIGVKQSSRAIKEGRAGTCYIAEDASEKVTGPIVALCTETGTTLVRVPTMAELGDACGIKVGSAVAVLLK